MADPVVTPPSGATPPTDASALASTLYPNGMQGENPAAAAGDPPAVEPTPASAPAASAPAAPAADPTQRNLLAGEKSGEGEPPPEGPPEGEPPAPAEYTVESYAELKVPDTIMADDAIVGEFKTLSAELKIAPEAAQRVVEFYEKALTAAASAQVTNWRNIQNGWASEINAMPEFQGERAAQSAAMLGGMIEEYGDSSVREFFRATGDHPGVVKMILGMAKALVEDGPIIPGNPVQPNKSAGRKTLGQVLYPTANQ